MDKDKLITLLIANSICNGLPNLDCDNCPLQEYDNCFRIISGKEIEKMINEYIEGK